MRVSVTGGPLAPRRVGAVEEGARPSGPELCPLRGHTQLRQDANSKQACVRATVKREPHFSWQVLGWVWESGLVSGTLPGLVPPEPSFSKIKKLNSVLKVKVNLQVGQGFIFVLLYNSLTKVRWYLRLSLDKSDLSAAVTRTGGDKFKSQILLVWELFVLLDVHWSEELCL